MQELEYDEFGNMMKNTNPDFQPVTYTGGLYDKDTKFLRLGARDYDSTVGRWTTKDPIGFNGGDTNLYAYVGGNPMSYVDPSGNFGLPILVIAPIGGAVAGAIGSFSGTLIGGGSLNDALASVKGGAIAGGAAGFTAALGAGTFVAASVVATVDILYSTTTAIDSVPGNTPVIDVSNGINSILRPNFNNRLKDKNGCIKK